MRLLPHSLLVAFAALVGSGIASTGSARAAPETLALAAGMPGHSAAFTAWLRRNGDTAVSLETESESIVRQETWTPWPVQTAKGVEYVIDATVNASPAACQVVAAMVAARLGATLLDHGVSRAATVTLTCNESSGQARWTPPEGDSKGALTSANPSRGGQMAGAFDYVPSSSRPRGLDFEIELLARTAFEENPRRTLDYGAATWEPWFQSHAGKELPLVCWPSYWGGYDRQCTLSLPKLQPRQCAALGLYAGYRDLLVRVNDGLSSRHTFELTAWCGPNRATIHFTRNYRAEVEWFRGDNAASEMSTTINRRPPVAFKAAGNGRAAFTAEVDARDGEFPNPSQEAIRRMGLIGRWLGVEGQMDTRPIVDAIARDLKCEPNRRPGAVAPLSCVVSAAPPGLTVRAACRTAAFAAATILPRESKSPLAGQREFELTLPCDGKGRRVVIERELDFMSMVETHPDENPSDLKSSSSDTIDVWSAEFENLREVR